MHHSALLNVMIAAARKTARALKRDFGELEKLQVSLKGPANFVSSADRRAEETLYQELSKARPGYRFLGEEGGSREGADKSHRWIVDPLDGTTNFLHGLPHFAISIGLERDGEIVAGVIYEPVRDERFWAERGAGAFLNDRRLRVSARRTLAEALIGTGIPFVGRGDHQSYLLTLGAVMAATSGVRRLGVASLDLAYVAAGRLDGFWEFNLQPWDLAAGLLVVREAGGYVSDAAAGQGMLGSGDVIAANDYLHPLLVQLLKKALKEPAAK
jgi:myo-inositol-1(or 4)-monophosphatase